MSAIGDAIQAAIAALPAEDPPDSVATGKAIWEVVEQLILGGQDYAVIALSANQTTSIAVGNHIEFDAISQRGTGIALATGGGQGDGIITLAQARIWLVQSYVGVITSSAGTGVVRTRWVEHPGNATVEDDTGVVVRDVWLADLVAGGHAQVAHSEGFIVTPSSSLVLKQELITATGLTSFIQGSRVVIREL